MSMFQIDPSSDQSPGECSPTNLYQNLQTLHLQATQPGPATVPAATGIQRLQFSGDAGFRPDEQQLLNGPYPVDVVGPAFVMESLPMGDDLLPGPSIAYGCGTVPLGHPNLQVIREDLASSQGTVSDSGSRSDTPQSRPRPTVSPPHPVISVTDALGRVMPVVMVTEGDASASDDAVPMDNSAAAACLVDFPAGYFAGYKYSGNYPVADSPLDLSQTCAAAHSDNTGDLCSTMIRTHRSAHDLYCDLSQALESSPARELVRRRDVESGLFALANASVSLEVWVCHGSVEEQGGREERLVGPPQSGAALCFRHVAGDVGLYDSICRELVSRLSL